MRARGEAQQPLAVSPKTPFSAAALRLPHAARVYRGSRPRRRTRLNEAEGDDMISDWTEVAETFDSMGLHENLLRGIYAYGAPPPAPAAGGADAARRRASRRDTHAAAGLTLRPTACRL